MSQLIQEEVRQFALEVGLDPDYLVPVSASHHTTPNWARCMKAIMRARGFVPEDTPTHTCNADN